MRTAFDEFLTTAKTAATEASTLLRANFQSTYDITQKQEGTLVTEVDLRAEQTIRSIIMEAHPEHAIISEEAERDGSARFTWVVDPLDGTANYVTGFEHYCVSIALLDKGEPIVGVVVHPQREDTYTAVAGGGTRRNGRRISVSSVDSLPESTVLFGISPPIVHDSRLRRLYQHLFPPERSQGLRQLGAGACDLSFVANGTFECFLDKYTSPWDVAAGSLLVKEADGKVTDWNGSTVNFMAEEREVGIIASNGRVHGELRHLYRNEAASLDTN
ncbi:inositol monophosphatase family protein [Natrialba sp. PRR66]|uniref:inositol monophosphatase family protein n=1 Tax=Natrialba sp. PRR66 TaxID=3098146 RepID=UPI002B1DC413|nr:inositol monophosphatase family protein [Natrialba sp. PRR66]